MKPAHEAKAAHCGSEVPLVCALAAHSWERHHGCCGRTDGRSPLASGRAFVLTQLPPTCSRVEVDLCSAYVHHDLSAPALEIKPSQASDMHVDVQFWAGPFNLPCCGSVLHVARAQPG